MQPITINDLHVAIDTFQFSRDSSLKINKSIKCDDIIQIIH